jgi:GT2 family glycosyltransferase
LAGLGRTAAELRTADFGFFGYLPPPAQGPVTRVELRDRISQWHYPLDPPRTEPVPETLFAWLDLDDAELSSSTLAPLTHVIRQAPEPPRPAVQESYRHRAYTGTAEIGIVVPVYGTPALLRHLLLSLASCNPEHVQLTVVCDDPELTPELTAWMTEWNDGVYNVPACLLVHDRNAGFAAACNTGWRANISRYQLLLNSDVLVPDPVGGLATLRQTLDSGAAAAAPVLLFPDGTVQHAGMRWDTSPDFPGFTLPLHPGKHDPVADLPQAPFASELLTGAAVLVERSLLETVGGVPTVYGRGDFEDALLCEALSAHGPLMVVPSVRWIHQEGASYHREETGGVPLTLAKSLVARERLTAGR